MIIVYTKEKQPKYLFDTILTKEEVEKSGGLFIDHPELKEEECLVVETNFKFQYPISDDLETVREATREEAITLYNAVELLKEGEKLVDGEIQTVEKPLGLIIPIWNGKEWVESYTEKDKFRETDTIKANILEEGYEWKGHKQKCRDKDISLLVSTIAALKDFETMESPRKITWYFNENDGVEMGVQELSELRLYGLEFIQAVYDVENTIKTGKLFKPTKEYYKEQVDLIISKVHVDIK